MAPELFARLTGERMPTLAQAIDCLQSLQLYANIEIKPAAGFERETGRVAARLIASRWPAGALPPLLSSFSPEALEAAKLYNALARKHGLTPTQLALAFCYTNWRVASTIIGVTSTAQLDENLAAWGTTLSPELLAEIDFIREKHRDPAQ